MTTGIFPSNYVIYEINCLILYIKQSRQNRYFFKLLPGEPIDLGKRGIKLKLASVWSYWWRWGSLKSWNLYRQKRFQGQKMTKFMKKNNITLVQFFCQRAAIRVANLTERRGKKKSFLKLLSFNGFETIKAEDFMPITNQGSSAHGPSCDGVSPT